VRAGAVDEDAGTADVAAPTGVVGFCSGFICFFIIVNYFFVIAFV
jgi:hypothetical protein